MERVYLSIGTNSGDRHLNITNALAQIEEHLGPVEDSSSIFQTESWGFDSDDFYNLVILVRVSIDSRALLDELKAIERSLGRVSNSREDGYQARVIDIDILTYGNEVIDEPGLRVPHVGIAYRNFVLMPWSEIAGEIKIPGMNQTVSELLEMCPDNSICDRIADV